MTRELAVNCYSYIWKLSTYDTIAHIADMGYRGMELMVNWPHLWPSDLGTEGRRRVRRLLEERAMRILSLAPPMLDLNLVSPAPEMRRYTLDHYIAVIRLAAEWNVPWVVVVPGKTHPLLPLPDHYRDRWFDDALLELDRAAEAEGIEIAVENVPNSFLPHAEHLMERLALIGNDRIGITYDVANAVFAGEDPAHGLEVVAPRLRFVHLSDTGVKVWAHAKVGTGVVPFDRIGDALERIGFEGPSTMEIISDRPDEDILASHAALSRFGWNAPPKR
ncbi:MAG: sugar phosphate isomerase/epimerase [Rhizobiaceae bacterium]|nr:sugar phosphate isomerase/epimerase [Rhizobiaceae bacterium]